MEIERKNNIIDTDSGPYKQEVAGSIPAPPTMSGGLPADRFNEEPRFPDMRITKYRSLYRFWEPARCARKTSRVVLWIGFALAVLCGSAQADLPEGPGKAATVRVCGKCHSPERAVSLHQSHSAWEDTIVKMMKLGAQGSDEELEAVLGYLSTHFGPEAPKPIDINKARAVDLEAVLLLKRSQAKAVIEYRTKNGSFKSIDDLRNIPGLDFRKLEAKKSRLVF